MKTFIFSLLFSLSLNAASPMIWEDANYGKMLTALGIHLSDAKAIRILSVDPTAGGGVAAAVGSIGMRSNAGVGELWLKTGAAATAWGLARVGLIDLTTSVTGVLPLVNGGTGVAAASANEAFNALSPMTTGGDLIYGGASGIGTRLANGNANDVLSSAGGTSAPTWVTRVSLGSTTAGASTLAARNGNAALLSTYFVPGRTSTATAGGTTTLTASMNGFQLFTGSSTQTLVMPVVTTLSNGTPYLIINQSSGAVTVQSSGGNTIQVMGANSTLMLTLTSASADTTAAPWNVIYIPTGGNLLTAASTATLTNKTIDADGTGNSITNIENADIKAAAAIDATKIADGSVTSAEFQFINTVTSNVQTQLGTKVTNPMDSAGDLIYGGASGTPTKLDNGTTGQRLIAAGASAPVWTTPVQVAMTNGGDPTITITGSASVAKYPAADTDTNSGYAAGTGLYTVPSAGSYAVTASIAVSATYAANNNVTIAIFKNGAAVRSNLIPAGSASVTTIVATIVADIDCAATDTIGIYVSSNGTSPTVASGVFNFFDLHRVGNL